MIIDSALWEIYNKLDVSEWSRFWILKLLVSNKDVSVSGIEKEIKRILSTKENTIFKIVCFYYQAIQGIEINIEQIKQAVDGSKTDVEKSLYSFFLLNAFQKSRLPVIKNHIEKLLDANSHELNLIGSYLFKNKPKASIDNFDGIFSGYLLEKKPKKKVSTKNVMANNNQQNDFYLVRKESLISISSDVFGMNRHQKKKYTIDLDFPEIVQWKKVLLKIKDGLQDIEIWYDNQHIKTTDYIELGFSSNKKEHKPDRKWSFLCILSVLQNEDITQATPNNITSMLAKRSNATISRANVHQTKRLLSKILRSIFKTGENPFIDNKKYYEPKFKVLPETIMRNKELWKQGISLNENINYNNEE
jgi:hypothetical protein